MASPTPQEIEMVTKLKERLQHNEILLSMKVDDVDLDGMLLRFLRARGLNLNKAEDMLIQHLKWRVDNDIESIHSWTPSLPLSRENYPYEITGVDKEGCPVLVVGFGQWDIRRLCEEGVQNDYIRYVDQLFFRVSQAMQASSSLRGESVSQFIIIMVPDNLAALRQMSCKQAVDAVLETVRRFEANHPETLKRAFVIDTPKVFQIILSAIRPFIDSKTLGKVTIAGGSKEWRTALQELIDSKHLPSRLGGSYVSKYDVFNKIRIPPNPSYSLQRCGDGSSTAFFTRTVPPGRSLSIEYHIPAPRTQFSWAFKTERWDIGFSILYDGTEVIVPFSRLDSHQQLQCGSVLCEHSGKYVIVFDNTFSRWRSKVVRYKVVLRPEGGENGDNINAVMEAPNQLRLEDDLSASEEDSEKVLDNKNGYTQWTTNLDIVDILTPGDGGNGDWVLAGGGQV